MAKSGEYGEVISVEGSLVKVRMKPQASCGSCVHRRVCFPAGRYRVLVARSKGGIKEGDYVFISGSTGAALLSQLLVFVGPVVVVLGTVLIAEFLGAKLWMTITAAASVLVAYLAGIIILDVQFKKKGKLLPKAEKADKSHETECEQEVGNEPVVQSRGRK